MNRIVGSACLLVAAVSVVACGSTQQSAARFAPAHQTAASVLRVATNRHETVFAGRASYMRTASGLTVSIDGRSIVFPGAATAERDSFTNGEAARTTRSLPVTCADCADGNGGGGSSNSKSNCVQGVDLTSGGVEVTFTTSGNGETVTMVPTNSDGSSGTPVSVDTNYTAGLLVAEEFDGSMFVGGRPDHGRVTITSKGQVVGSGSW